MLRVWGADQGLDESQIKKAEEIFTKAYDHRLHYGWHRSIGTLVAASLYALQVAYNAQVSLEKLSSLALTDQETVRQIYNLLSIKAGMELPIVPTVQTKTTSAGFRKLLPSGVVPSMVIDKATELAALYLEKKLTHNILTPAFASALTYIASLETGYKITIPELSESTNIYPTKLSKAVQLIFTNRKELNLKFASLPEEIALYATAGETFKIAHPLITKISSELKIGRNIKEGAIEIFAQIASLGLTKGRSTKILAISSVYASLTANYSPISRQEFISRTGINKRLLNKTYKLITEHTGITSRHATPESHLRSISEGLKVPDSLRAHAAEILFRAKAKLLTQGVTPALPAATALWMACRLDGSAINQTAICKAANVIPTSIQRLAKIFDDSLNLGYSKLVLVRRKPQSIDPSSHLPYTNYYVGIDPYILKECLSPKSTHKITKMRTKSNHLTKTHTAILAVCGMLEIEKREFSTLFTTTAQGSKFINFYEKIKAAKSSFDPTFFDILLLRSCSDPRTTSDLRKSFSESIVALRKHVQLMVDIGMLEIVRQEPTTYLTATKGEEFTKYYEKVISLVANSKEHSRSKYMATNKPNKYVELFNKMPGQPRNRTAIELQAAIVHSCTSPSTKLEIIEKANIRASQADNRIGVSIRHGLIKEVGEGNYISAPNGEKFLSHYNRISTFQKEGTGVISQGVLNILGTFNAEEKTFSEILRDYTAKSERTWVKQKLKVMYDSGIVSVDSKNMFGVTQKGIAFKEDLRALVRLISPDAQSIKTSNVSRKIPTG